MVTQEKAGLDAYSGYSSIKYLSRMAVIGTHNSASFGVKGPLKSINDNRGTVGIRSKIL